TSVPNNVNEQRMRYIFPDSSHVQDAVGIVNRPALYALALCDSIHHDPDEVARIAAFRQQFGGEWPRIHAGAPEALTLHPGVDDLLPIAWIRKSAEPWDQDFIDGKI